MSIIGNKNIFELPLKKNQKNIQKFFNYVYRKDDSFYIHEPVHECSMDALYCENRFACSLCFMSTCEKHCNAHSNQCSGRDMDKCINHHINESDSVLRYGVCIAISILRNTTNLDTFRRLMLSHYLFRRAVLEDKQCRTMFIESSKKRGVRARLHKGIRKSAICNKLRCKHKKSYCLNCARLFCKKHIVNHNICGNEDSEKCVENAEGRMRYVIFHTQENGTYQFDHRLTVTEFIQSWDEETLIKVLQHNYKIVINVDPKKYSKNVFDCIWKKHKHLAYMLLDKTNRTSYMYVKMLEFIGPARDKLNIESSIFNLCSLPTQNITRSALEAWLKTDKSRQCGVMLDFDFINQNHLIIAVNKSHDNIQYIPKHLQTEEICNIALSQRVDQLPWCNLDMVSSEHSYNYVSINGDCNNIIFSRLNKRFPEACGKGLEEYKRKQEERKRIGFGRQNGGGPRIGGLGGGLMSLVAYGSQDIYLTGSPHQTFFRRF